MGNDSLNQGRKPLSIAQQVGKMSMYPQLKYAIKRSTAVWTGAWWPTLLSDKYDLKISYSFRSRPRISIISPILRLADGHSRLPHVYRDGQYDICVHIPEDWNPQLYIAETIMPWVSQWLAFYETWVQTGVWLGKGTHREWPQHFEGKDDF